MRSLSRSARPAPSGLLGLAWLAWLAACGGSASGSGSDGGNGEAATTVVGMVGDASVPATYSIGVEGMVTTFAGVSAHQVGVLISNLSPLCSAIQQNVNVADSTQLVVRVVALAPVTPATYAITPQASLGAAAVSASLLYEKRDATCNMTERLATSGSVTLSAIGSTVEGTFDVTLDTGEKLSGTFDSPLCDLGVIPDSTAPSPAVCMQPSL